MAGPILTVVVSAERHGVAQPIGQATLEQHRAEIGRALRMATMNGRPLDSDLQDHLSSGMAAAAQPGEIWGNGSHSLIIIIGPDRSIAAGSESPLPDGFSLSTHPRAHLLVSTVDRTPAFNLLQLSLKTVRLWSYENGIATEISLDTTPTSIDEALRFDDPERRLTNHTAGTASGHDMRFHGHGVGDEVDAVRTERFLRQVDRGVTAALRHHHCDDRPLIVHGSTDHIATLQQVTALGTVLRSPVHGPLTIRSASDVAAHASEFTRAARDEHEQRTFLRWEELRGTGMTAEGADSCHAFAHDGRVETLLVAHPDRAITWDPTAPELASDAIDLAIIDTLTHGGEVVMVEGDRSETVSPCVGLLRF